MSKNRKVITELSSEYTKVPNRLFNLAETLSKRERRIYCTAIAVYSLVVGSAEWFHPGLRYLATKLGVSKDTVRKAIRLLVRRHLLIPGPHVNGHRIHYIITPPDHWLAEGDPSSIQDGGVPQASTDASCGEVHNNKETINKNNKASFLNSDQGDKSQSLGSENKVVTGIQVNEFELAERCPGVLLPTHTHGSLAEILNDIKNKN